MYAKRWNYSTHAQNCKEKWAWRFDYQRPLLAVDSAASCVQTRASTRASKKQAGLSRVLELVNVCMCALALVIAGII